jgi:hypothetical protein
MQAQRKTGRLICRISTVKPGRQPPEPREIWALAFQGQGNDKHTHFDRLGFNALRDGNAGVRHPGTRFTQGMKS